MSEELKPCPLCGSGAHAYDDGYGDLDSVPAWIAACDDETGCGCETAFFDTREEAVAAWNRRAERTCRMQFDDREYRYRCSRCGSLSETYRSTDGKWYAPEYCSSCGAKVVSE